MIKTTVLVVEDEAIVAEDLASKLGQLGYEVVGTAARGDEAVEKACRLKPDVVLMDIMLKGSMDGIAATEAIRRRFDVPVIYLTAYSDPATLERAKLSEPFGYILKPFEERELATIIEMALYKHQADRQLREQREWLRVTLTSIGDAVITCDTEGQVNFLNPVAEALTGWATDEARDLPIRELFRLIDERTGKPCEDFVSLVLREGRPKTLANHTTLVTRDGRRIPIEDSASPILDDNGRVIGAVLVFHDVTEKRRSQDALRKAHDDLEICVDKRTRELKAANESAKLERQRLYGVLETLPVYVALLTADHHMPFANREFRERFGEPGGRRCFEFLFNRSEPCEICETYTVLKTNTPHRWEWDGPDGRSYDIYDYPFADSDGSPLILEMGIDITERKMAEKALKELNDTLEERIIERTAALDAANKSLRASRIAALNLMEDSIAARKQAEETRDQLSLEIAERKRAEEALQRAHDELEARVEERTAELREKDRILLLQSRQAAMGEMIGNIAHQWRQPLNSLSLLIGTLPALQEAGELTAENLDYLEEKTMGIIQHMSQTINDFRHYFKPDKERVPFRTGDAVAKTVTLIEDSFGSREVGIEIVTGENAVINGYPNEFSQVLLNILLNARDAFSERRVKEPKVVIKLTSENGRAVVTVTDNAGGIPEEIIDKIFDPYFTTKGPEHGTGVGLFMSKGIIEKNMGGRLTARNIGNGAEFRIEV